MRPAEPISLTLAVGDPVRAAVGRAVRGSLLLAATFVVFTWAAKELPSLYARAPWQDDPYDALISFTIFAVPLLAGLCLVRAPLCRRLEPLPVRRALDLARAGQLLVGAVLVTAASEWVSVALGDHRSAWTAVTIVLIGMLSLVSVLSGAVAAQLWRARRNLPADSRLLAQPDWLADAAVTGERLAARLERRHQAAAGTLRRLERAMLADIARHPVGSAAVASLGFGVFVSVTQALGEGYRPRAALLFLAVPVASMFAFLLAAGTHLHLARPRDRSAGRVLRPLVAASASVPVTFAFRDSLVPALGLPPRHSLPAVSGLVVLVAIAVGVAVIAVESARGHMAAARRRNARSDGGA
jgi:hypothetical protein